jgi:hypothetical protein
VDDDDDEEEEDCDEDGSSSVDVKPVWDCLEKVDEQFEAFLGEHMHRRAASFFAEVESVSRRVDVEVRSYPTFKNLFV